jgi:cyclopropane fatty-acyl-phospholipid synthase-like methyltransferase
VARGGDSRGSRGSPLARCFDIEPESDVLACGDIGEGWLASLDAIAEEAAHRGACVTLGSGQTSAAARRIDTAGVYWDIAVAATGKIMKGSLSGGTPMVLADN